MKLEHAAFNLTAPIEQSKWFVDHLGLRIVVANTTAPYAHFLADEAGSMLELYHNTAVPVPDYATIDAFNLHFAFSSANIEADCARLIAAGATQIGTITTNALGDKLTFLRTPWQVPIQLVQRVKPLV